MYISADGVIPYHILIAQASHDGDDIFDDGGEDEDEDGGARGGHGSSKEGAAGAWDGRYRGTLLNTGVPPKYTRLNVYWVF